MNSQKNPRKVVSIPIHFVTSTSSTATSSENATSENDVSSAMRIQKSFRGFLVRKNLKKVMLIKKEVDEVEKRVMDNLEVIRRDPKERLRMNETLMGLLLKLDSVQGVGHGVRECRKAVIKKAIVLQEIIDGCDVSRNTNQDPGISLESGDLEKPDGNADLANHDSISKNGSQGLETEGDVVCQDENIEISDQGLDIGDGSEKVVVLDEEMADRALEFEGKTSCLGNECTDKSNESINQDIVKSEDDCLHKPVKCDKLVEPEMEDDEEDYCMVKKVVVGEGDCYKGDDDKLENYKNREILERMMEENVKMMNMMKQLSEQHQAQTQMLSLLSHRVEQLEKAFVHEASRKKSKDKKKRAANGVTNVLDFCPSGKER